MNTEMILKLDKLQPRKDKPAVLGSITLLDIVANGTAIRLFKETVVVYGETSRKRIVMNVRRHSGKGWGLNKLSGLSQIWSWLYWKLTRSPSRKFNAQQPSP